MEILVNGGWVSGAPSHGQKYRETLSDGSRVESYYFDNATSDGARVWRDSELSATDWIVSVTDHPKHALALAYRQELRDWPDTANFPHTKPINPLNAV